MKIKSTVSFVDEKGTSRRAGEIVEVSKDFYEKLAALLKRFNYPKPEVIEDKAKAEVEAEAPVESADKAQTGKAKANKADKAENDL